MVENFDILYVWDEGDIGEGDLAEGDEVIGDPVDTQGGGEVNHHGDGHDGQAVHYLGEEGGRFIKLPP